MKSMNKRNNVQFKEVELRVNLQKIEYIKGHLKKDREVEL